MTRFHPDQLRLYLVLDPGMVPDPLEAVRASIQGGVSMVQLRWKDATDREIMEFGSELIEICGRAGVPLLINDRLDIARAIGAHGIHLGVNDLPVSIARQLSPDGFVIGYSPDSDVQITSATGDGADYLGIGPFAATATKPDAGTALGAVEFARRRHLTDLPVVAIGGISVDNAREAVVAGADGVAVVSAILGSDDPGLAASQLLEAVRAGR